MSDRIFDDAWLLLLAHPKAGLVYRSELELTQGKRLYRAVLQGVGPEILHAAIAQAVANAPGRFPEPGDIVNAARMIESAFRSQSFPKTGMDAWGDILSAIHSGRYEVDDEIATRVARGLGGIRRIGQLEMSDLSVARAHFLKAYDAVLETEREKARLLPAVRRIVERLAVGMITGEDGNENGQEN